MPRSTALFGWRSVRNVICVSFGALAAHSCATAPPSSSLTADDLLSAPYSFRSGTAFDVDAFLATFPTWLAASYDSASFDAARGAMVVENLRFGFAAEPEAGFIADRAVIWGADIGAMEAVFSGTANNAAKADLFDRMMLEGVRSAGMQWDTGAESASVNIDKLVIDGLAARSYNLAPKAGVDEGVQFIRSVAAALNSFSYDGVAYSNLAVRLANNSGEKVELEIDEAFTRGYESGATEFQSARGIRAFIQNAAAAPIEVSADATEKPASDDTYAKILNNPPSEGVNELIRRPVAMLASATGGVNTSYNIDYVEARSSDLTGALSWLSRWELPPITETDLIDLGAQTMLGYRESWDGQEVYSIDSVEIQAADFYWLIPSNYTGSYEGMTYGLSSFVDAIEGRMGAGFATESGQQIAEFRDALTGLGIETITGSSDFAWRWNGATGDASMSTSLNLTDLINNDVGFGVSGPNLARWDEMARADTPFAEVMNEMSLHGANIGIGDRGLMAKAFDYAAMKQGGGMSGEELRQSISAMARLTGVQAGQMNPRIADYANAAADFIAGGGRLDIVAAPQAPLSFMTLQSAGETAPETLPDVINLTITHTPE